MPDSYHTYGDNDLSPFSLKITRPVTVTVAKVIMYTKLDFQGLLFCEQKVCIQCTDGHTDIQLCLTWPRMEGSHNKHSMPTTEDETM